MKNSDVLHYKGYTARPEYSVEDRVFYGTILGIDALVDFQSESAKDLEEQLDVSKRPVPHAAGGGGISLRE